MKAFSNDDFLPILKREKGITKHAVRESEYELS